MCVRVASWVGTAGLQYAAPCETSDQMLLLRMVLKSSALFAFLVFGLSGFFSERVAPRRFFMSFEYGDILCVLVLCGREMLRSLTTIQSMWPLLVSTWQ